MKSLNSKYFSRIDHLRFIAATFVVFVHSYSAFGGGDSDNIFIKFMLSGDTGVTLFLVLSGFLFTIISDGGKKNIEYKKFIFNRFIRIFPLLSIAWITSMSLSRGTATFSDAMTVLLFSNLQTSPLLAHFGQTWTIAVEFQFYLIFPFLALFLNRYGVKYIIYLSLFWLMWRTMIVTIYGGNLVGDGYLNNHYYYLTMLGRFDQLLIGMIFGYLYIRYSNKFKNPLFMILSMALVLYLFLYLEVRAYGISQRRS
ncbi:acyltransferase [Citrobacter portucalensis]|nr:acyltransferase [Citrobacter portucalensis]MEB1081750.1 acyltransferase [Citrobacter portucalensis]